MIRRPFAWLSSALVVSTFASASLAHVTLLEPVPRHGPDDLKFGPCGLENGDARTTDPSLITTFQAGETITVRWYEGVNHPSHFRISLAPSDSDFTDPTGFTDVSGGPYVLLDDIEDDGRPPSEDYVLSLTLPNEPCPTCTLQLIQVMQDKAPWGDGNDIYYQCADLVIEGGTVGTGGTGGAAPGSGGFVGSGGVPSGSGGVPSGSGGTVTGTGQSFTGGASSSSDTDDSMESGCQLTHSGSSISWPAGVLWFALSLISLRRTRRRAG